MITAALGRELEQRLGSTVQSASQVAGGDINHAYRVELADGRSLFVKTQPRALPRMFECEAAGLAWLRDAGALRIPDVLASGDQAACAFLALEWIDTRARAADYDERLGHGLAALHRAGAAGFGFAHDNYIATLPQANRANDRWPRFYFEQRIAPLLERAQAHGSIDTGLRQRFDRLETRIDSLCGPHEPAARLHGDLWAGNALSDERGQPVLIDPAVYGGHREIDLAMMQLFGGFGPRCFAAYDEAHPRAPGHQARVALYQLYPLLVHVNLFGAGYLSGLQRALSSIE